jgi:conjugative relaxase-like TrwC/TraI family protein
VLSIGKLVDPNYYLDKVADGVSAYYGLQGEAPGQWIGRGAARLRLGGQVDGAQLKAILAGSDPAAGDPLGAGASRKNMGFDLCFRAPKSVSVLAGLGDPDTVTLMHACHDRAVAAAIDYLERTATWTRRGHNGVEVLRGDGLVGAAFRHRTSRAQDPHLHTHVLVANLTFGADGRWATLDGRFVYAQAKTAGYLYEAHLRAELTRELGVEWGLVRNGIADVRGVPGAVLRMFSKRRAEIEARLGELGFSSPRAAEVATLDTRRRKTHGLEGGVVRARWRGEAAALGFGPAEYAEVFRRSTGVQVTAEVEEQIGSVLSSPAGLTRRVSTFDRPDVLQAVCDRLPSGAPITTVEEVADRYLARPEVIELGGASRTTLRRDDGKVVPLHPDSPTYSTVELLAVEERLVSSAMDRQDTGCGVATAEALSATPATHPALSPEQARLVVALTTTGNGVDVVAAAAGTGKTFSLDAARHAWSRSGYRVIGCALAARAAAELEAGAGIPSITVARLLADLDDPNQSLGPHTIVVCDEAAMVGSRDLERLAAHAADAGAKLVLCGDARQLPSVDAGGGFAALGRRLGVLTLTENRRQREAWERDALARLRSGHVDDALDRYDKHGRVFRGPTAEDVREAIVAHWWAARTAGDSTLMLAARRSDVDDLNARARARMLLAGKLSGPELIVDDRPYQAGDRIMTLRNDYRLEVRNGTVATVLAVSPDARTMTVRTDSDITITLPSAYLDAGKVTLAYASTVHKAQGQTAEHALLLGNDDLFLELG